ncbi:hypothetical protein MHU86_20811 [Fragilaria crotonensis]|nr:hypothetical protein MHU86_20811 [Fragilaria crotonensis]
MRDGYKSMMEQSKTTRSVLTSYVRNLQQRRPGSGAWYDGTETQSLRKARVQNDAVFTKHKDLVGRDKELLMLRDCYNRVVTMKVTEVVTIHGPSGAGKSALVRSFFDTLPEGVFHMEGRFNQLQSRAPYVALAAASDQFCRQIMRHENSTELRNRIRAVLGPM